jgi:hypothetical protein
MNCIQNSTTCPCLELMAEHSTTISSVGSGITIGSGFDTTTSSGSVSMITFHSSNTVGGGFTVVTSSSSTDRHRVLLDQKLTDSRCYISYNSTILLQINRDIQ